MKVVQPTLVEAFRLAGPEVWDSALVEVNRIRAASTRVLYEEMERLGAELAERGRFQSADIDDARQEFLFGFIQKGPRADRHGNPETNEHARNYLRRSLIHRLIDIVGGARVPEPPLPPESPEEHIIASIELREARQQLFDEIIPALTSLMAPGAGAVFAKTVTHLRSLAAGESRFEVLLAEELAVGPTRRRLAPTTGSLKRSVPSESERAAARLYTRFSRVLAKIEEAVSAEMDSGRLSRERADALLVVIDELRLRPT